tara:strand:+ start:668 stop:919 length:252 start_codon:yes stop_codon:yes gene_type:complete
MTLFHTMKVYRQLCLYHPLLPVVNNLLLGISSHLLDSNHPAEEGYFHLQDSSQISLKENLSPLPRICFLNRGSKLLDKNTCRR